jgi:hypothetical protein
LRLSLGNSWVALLMLREPVGQTGFVAVAHQVSDRSNVLENDEPGASVASAPSHV